MRLIEEWLPRSPGPPGPGDRNDLIAVLENARAEVTALRTSASWRVTAPLRGLYDRWLALSRRR
jgi:hypothetical protein